MDEHTRDDSVDPPRGSPTGWNDAADRWDHATLRKAVVHGVRLFNAGDYHESHDCFEHEWYQYGQGTTESAFLHGLVQVAAGTYKRADFADDDGMRSLFRTARQYLEGVPADFYGLEVDTIRETLERALDDPTVADGWQLRLDGRIETADDRDFAYIDAIEDAH